MSFVPENLAKRACRDPLFKGESEITVRSNLDRAMKNLIDIYKCGCHKCVWTEIDRYALHGLITAYTLDENEEDNAFDDLQTFEHRDEDLDEQLLVVLHMLDRCLWDALTCTKRAEFSYHCNTIQKVADSSKSAREFCLSIVGRFRKPASIVDSDGLVNEFVFALWERLQTMHKPAKITKCLRRLSQIVNKIGGSKELSDASDVSDTN